MLDWLQEEIDTFFQPVAAELPVIAAEMANDAEAARLLLPKSALHGILAVTPQVQGVLYLTTDLKAYRYRRGTGAEPPEDWSQVADMRALMAAARPDAGVTWGALVWSSELRRTVINARLPIVRDGRLRGLLFAAVSLETMVRYVDNLSRKVGQPVFVLEGRDRVIAAPNLDTANLGPDRPLPLLAEAGDPVLAAIWAGATQRLGILERGCSRRHAQRHGVERGLGGALSPGSRIRRPALDPGHLPAGEERRRRGSTAPGSSGDEPRGAGRRGARHLLVGSTHGAARPAPGGGRAARSRSSS